MSEAVLARRWIESDPVESVNDSCYHVAMGKDRIERIWEMLCDLVDSVREQEMATEKVAPVRRVMSSGGPLKPQVDAYEMAIVSEVIAVHGGRMASAARELGITREGLYKIAKRHGIVVDRRLTSVDQR